MNPQGIDAMVPYLMMAQTVMHEQVSYSAYLHHQVEHHGLQLSVPFAHWLVACNMTMGYYAFKMNYYMRKALVG